MPIEHVNDIDIYYEIHGEGESLLNILGMGMNIASFSNPAMIRQLAEKYRVITADNRGMGRTSEPDAPFTVETMAGDTLGLLDALGIEKARVIGGSLGACVAQVITAQHPDRVERLVLHGAASRYPFLMRQMVRLTPKIPFLRRKSVEMAEPIFRESYPPTEISYLNQCIAGVMFDGRDYLPEIRAPTLILNMAHDQYVPMKFTRELAEGIRGSRLELIDRDHLFLLKEPELVTGPALAFLAGDDTNPNRT